MATANRQQTNLQSAPYYHCIYQCARSTFLCGFDDYLGKNYDHRIQWVEMGLFSFAEAFCIDVVSYGVRAKQLEVILHVDRPQMKSLSDYDVIDRHGMIAITNGQMAHYRNGGEVTATEREHIDQTLTKWRDKLVDIGWYIGQFKQAIARKANKEEGCTGHFWEARSKRRGLVDDSALSQCMQLHGLEPHPIWIRQNIAYPAQEASN